MPCPASARYATYITSPTYQYNTVPHQLTLVLQPLTATLHHPAWLHLITCHHSNDGYLDSSYCEAGGGGPHTTGQY